MSTERPPGRAAWTKHGFLLAHRWLIARRAAQLTFLLLFLSGPLLGFWIAKGTLASSLTLDVLPLTDPLMALQSIVAGHVPDATALVGAVIVLVAYAILGGRLYCSWVCPVEPVTDLAAWLRRRLAIETDWKVKPETRLWVLGAVILTSAATSSIAFEFINPITVLYRGLLFGVSAGLLLLGAIFLLDLFIAKRGWCGHLCPVGAFYGLLNRGALIRVSAIGRIRCDDCMDCYAVCPEMHVIAPALKGIRSDRSPVITAADCTSCGRCIDVCPERVFRYTHRFDQRLEPPTTDDAAQASPGVTREAA